VSLNRITETGSITETEVEISARSEEDTESYETSVSFHGGSVIVGISYLHFVLYILVVDYIGISDAFELLALTFVLLCPMLQATWVIYEQWLSQLFPDKKLSSVILDMLFFFIIFLLSTLIKMVYRASPEDPGYRYEDAEFNSPNPYNMNPYSVRGGALVMAPLLFAYCTFVGWATLHVRWKEKRHQGETLTQRSWSRRLAIASALLPALLAPAVTLDFDLLPLIAMTMAAFLALQILLLLIDFAIQRRGLTDQLWIKNGIRVSLVAVSVILPFIPTLGGFSSPVLLVAAVIWTCPIWVAFYIGYEAVQYQWNGPKIVMDGQAT
jgi:hypothetical protein